MRLENWGGYWMPCERRGPANEKKNQERTARRKKFAPAMLLLGNAQTCPDIEYASGFRAVDPVLFLKKGPAMRLVVPQLEYGRATRTAVGVMVFSPEKLGLSGRRRGRFSEWALELLKHERGGA